MVSPPCPAPSLSLWLAVALCLALPSASAMLEGIPDSLDFTHFSDQEMKHQEGQRIVDITVPAQIINKRAAVRFCGVQLVSAIRLACDSIGGRVQGKRSAGFGPLYTSIYRPETEDPRFDRWEDSRMGDKSVMDRFKTLAIVRNMVKRGASDECCENPCTFAHLTTYCAV